MIEDTTPDTLPSAEEVKKWKSFFPDGRKLKILVVPANEGGCAFYRAWNPYKKLEELYPHLVDVRFDKNPLGLDHEKGGFPEDFDFENINWCDVVVMNNISNFGGPYTARVCGITKEKGKFFHMDTDDLLTDLYDGHRLKDVYKDRGLSDMTKHVYANSDLVTVTQHKFAERISEFCSAKLGVVKNAIDYNLDSWNVPRSDTPRLRKGEQVRISWAGGIHHEEDVKEFASVPHLVNSKVGREHVVWNFYGRPPVIDGVRDWQHNVWDNYERIMMMGFRGHKNFGIYPAYPAEEYGFIFAHTDIAIAPLQMNAFNDSKSDIKIAECGRYGVPLVASNVGCYSDIIQNGVTGYLLPPDAPKLEWVRILSKLIKDKKLRQEMGQNLKKLTDEYFDLNKVVHYRLVMYKECLVGNNES